jgi:hypothetical protein
MNHFSVTQFGNEIIATYSDDNVKLVIKHPTTGEFHFDCACIVEELYDKVEKEKEK